ncbi:MAG: SgcJ/EcaC family oxidoreductase [Acidobacteria bacterium]|nr:SgcJ/EcaC family oxidoreductase [Acidobacteriota bacterium]MCA1649771.1 SgcJ/EcaC family oxidoreductase [Acidobacteriota bacterium]
MISLVWAGAGFAQTPATSSGDDAAIRRVLQQQDDARNRGDWKALGELFTSDAEQFTSAGQWRRGRADIEKGVAETMTTTYKGGKYATKVETVRMLTPTVAIADGPFEISGIAGGSGTRRGHTTYALVKSGDRWQIAASRSMVPTAVGPTPPR